MSRLLKGEQIVVDTYLMLNRKSSKQHAIISDKQDTSEETLDTIKQQAERIINQAVAFREQTITQAEDKAVKVYEYAKKSGFKEGYSNGERASIEENRALLDKLVELISDIERKKDSFYDDNKNQIIILACDIARKIIDKQLNYDDEAFVNIFKKATWDLYDKKFIRLTVSMYEKDFVTSNTEYLLSLVKGVERIEIEVLEDAGRGTCVVETDDEIIDASVIKQTETIEQTLLGI